MSPFWQPKKPLLLANVSGKVMVTSLNPACVVSKPFSGKHLWRPLYAQESTRSVEDDKYINVNLKNFRGFTINLDSLDCLSGSRKRHENIKFRVHSSIWDFPIKCVTAP